MNLKDRIKSKSFWAGLIGSIFLILSAFGIEVGDQTASAVINAVCSSLVVLGIVVSPAAQLAPDDDSNDDNVESVDDMLGLCADGNSENEEK